MKLHEMKPTKGSRHSKKRVGRGIGSGMGKTSTRGENGQKKRGSGKIRPGFEGGQNPLYKRLPKRGFNNFNFETKYEVINLDKINSLNLSVITPSILIEKKVIRKKDSRIKILGDGEITKPIKIEAHKFSKSALEKIKKAGGSVKVIEFKKQKNSEEPIRKSKKTVVLKK